MPAPSDTFRFPAVQSAEKPVVPMIFLTDGSEPARVARDFVWRPRAEANHRTPEEACFKLSIGAKATVADAKAALEQRLDHGFAARARPEFRVHDLDPTWMVWLMEENKRNEEIFLESHRNLVRLPQAGLRHLVFWFVGKQWQPLRPSCGTDDRVTRFFLGEGTGAPPPVELGFAAAAYAFSSWRRYWESGINPANFRKHLLLDELPEQAGGYTLGVATESPDLEHLARSWHTEVARKLQEAWLKPAANPGAIKHPHPVQVVFGALPSAEYHLTDCAKASPSKRSGSTAGLMFPGTEQPHWELGFAKSNLSTRLPARTYRHSWPQDRIRFVELDSYLSLLAANAEMRLRHDVAREAAGLWEKLQKHLRSDHGESPGGFIARALARHSEAKLVLEPWRAVRAPDSKSSPKLNQQLKALDRAVEPLPSRWGLGLRLAVIALGTVLPLWLADGPGTPQASVKPWLPELRWAFGAGLLILGAAATADYMLMARPVRRGIERLRTSVFRAHLLRVAHTAASLIREAGEHFDRGLSQAERPWEQLKAHLKNHSDRPVPALPKLPQPIYHADKLRPLLEQVLEMLVRRVHEKLVAALLDPKGGPAPFDGSHFDRALDQHVRQVLEEWLASVSYADFAKLAVKPEEQRGIINCLRPLLQRPAVSGVSGPTTAPKFRLFAPGGWSTAVSSGVCESEPNWNGSKLLLVAPIALPGPAEHN